MRWDAAAHVGFATCRTGKLDPEKARALGVTPGKGFGTLKAGMPVQNKGERYPSNKKCWHSAVTNCCNTWPYSTGKQRLPFLTPAACGLPDAEHINAPA